MTNISSSTCLMIVFGIFLIFLFLYYFFYSSNSENESFNETQNSNIKIYLPQNAEGQITVNKTDSSSNPRIELNPPMRNNLLSK